MEPMLAFLMVTLAIGIAAPLESVTVPRKDVLAFCASARVGDRTGEKTGRFATRERSSKCRMRLFKVPPERSVGFANISRGVA